MTTRELYTVILPDGRELGFYDFDFTPGWQGNEIDPPESPEVDVQRAWWVLFGPPFGDTDTTVLTALRPTEVLSLLHAHRPNYLALLERCEEIVEARDRLLRDERGRAEQDSISADLIAADEYHARADDCSVEAGACTRQADALPRWRWLRAMLLRRRASEHKALANDYWAAFKFHRDRAAFLRGARR